MEPLTKKQKETLDYIETFMSKNGYAPSILEICKKFKLKARSTGWFRIHSLVKKRRIKRKRYYPRSIQVLST